jgi:hypothetical protein
MRLLASFLVIGFLTFPGCGGDTSVLMSVWNDSGVGGVMGHGGAGGSGGALPSGGGAGGTTIIGNGGSGGNIANTTVAVEGGARDLVTALCVRTICPDLPCLRENCSSSITECYYSDGISSAAGGKCQNYANCMLKCPCNTARKKCEDTCLQNHVAMDPDCSTCMWTLTVCTTQKGCMPPSTCTGTGGSSGGN